MNLNQPLDLTVSPAMGGTPMPFDASSLRGFYFEISGATVPAPKDLRFEVYDTAAHGFCNIPSKKLVVGANTFLFSDLVSECYKIISEPPTRAQRPHNRG